MTKMYSPCSLWSLFTYIYQQLSPVRLQKFAVSITVRICPLQKFWSVLTKACSIITKVCSVHIFPLQEFVVCAFLDYKSCSVRIFRLQKFVVSAFFHYKSLQCALFDYKSLQCPHFQTTKVCSVRIFPLQRFVVCAFLDYKSLQCLLFQTTKVCTAILDSVQVHGDICQCFRGVKTDQGKAQSRS